MTAVRPSTSNSAASSARSAPGRNCRSSKRSPSSSASASSRIDLPAPVSPVSTVKPRVELEVERLDDDKIADGQQPQHARALKAPTGAAVRASRSSAASRAASRSGRDPRGAAGAPSSGARRIVTRSPSCSGKCAWPSQCAQASLPRSERDGDRRRVGDRDRPIGERVRRHRHEQQRGHLRIDDRPLRGQRVRGRARSAWRR